MRIQRAQRRLATIDRPAGPIGTTNIRSTSTQNAAGLRLFIGQCPKWCRFLRYRLASGSHVGANWRRPLVLVATVCLAPAVALLPLGCGCHGSYCAPCDGCRRLRQSTELHATYALIWGERRGAPAPSQSTSSATGTISSTATLSGVASKAKASSRRDTVPLAN